MYNACCMQEYGASHAHQEDHQHQSRRKSRTHWTTPGSKWLAQTCFMLEMPPTLFSKTSEARWPSKLRIDVDAVRDATNLGCLGGRSRLLHFSHTTNTTSRLCRRGSSSYHVERPRVCKQERFEFQEEGWPGEWQNRSE